MRTGSAFGQQLAVATLFKTLSAGQLDAERKLKDVLGTSNSYIVDANARNARKKRDVVKNMQSLPQGAPIIIRNKNREDIVTFLELKRTRMVCEYPDGRLYSVPVTAFVRRHSGPAPERLEFGEGRRRELIRLLSGRRKNVAREEILRRGREMVKSLLDELSAAMDRARGLLRRPHVVCDRDCQEGFPSQPFVGASNL